MQKASPTSTSGSLKKLASWPVLINAGLFQLTWFACALGAAKGLVWPSVICCLLLAVYQLQPNQRHSKDILLIVVAISMGLIIDSAWIQLGLISYSSPWPFLKFAPAWIIILWIAFALTINHSLGWLKIHPILPALAGLICAPLSYLAGVKLGALEFLGDSLLTSCALGITWAVALTILVRMSQSNNT